MGSDASVGGLGGRERLVTQSVVCSVHRIDSWFNLL